MKFIDLTRKYFWIILILLSLVLGGYISYLLFSPKSVYKNEYEKWKKERDIYLKQHVEDSISFAVAIENLNKKKKQDSIKIIITQKNYEKIKIKYQEELSRIRSFNADQSLWFFSEQTQPSNDW